MGRLQNKIDNNILLESLINENRDLNVIKLKTDDNIYSSTSPIANDNWVEILNKLGCEVSI